MKVNSQLERAQFENVTSNPAAATAGRFFWNTTDGKAYLDDGTAIRSLLRNDGNAVFGNNGTAANNIRFHRGANGVLQFVSGADTTAEGTLSTALNQISAKQENYSAGTLPAFGNQGRLAYVTDTGFLNVDNGSAWKVLVDTNTAQTITGKTLTSSSLTDATITNAAIFTQIATPANPSAGFNKLYVKADGKFYTLDSAGNEASIGSGGSGGGGAKNLITNGSADDTASSIFVPYADAAGTRPVDGTGGSPTVTTSITSTNPLDGTKAFLLTKPASNCQGQGWAISNIAVPIAYRGKSLKSFFDYLVNSGTFVPGRNGPSPADGDVIGYFYDQTNNKLVEGSNIKLFSGDLVLSDKFETTVQLDSNCAVVRLILHIASTSTSAFELKLDNVTLSPQVYVYGTPVTNWSAQETTTGSLTNATYQRKWRQVGDSIHERVRIEFSSAPGGTNPLVVATKFTVDVAKFNTGVVQNTECIGVAHFTDVSTGLRYTGSIALNDVNGIRVQGDSATTGNWGSTNPVTIAAGDVIEIDYVYPAVGLGASVQTSDQADTRVVAAMFTAQTQSFPNASSDKFTTLISIQDTHGCLGSGRYTCKVAGFYEVLHKGSFNTTSGAFRAVEYYINGTYFDRAAGFNGTGSTATDMPAAYIVYLNVGDYLEFGAFQNTGAAENCFARISLSRISGPQAIAASEKIQFSMGHTSGQVLPAGVGTTLIYNVKEYDSHNIYNTSNGNFSFPRPGFVNLTARILTGNLAAGTTQYYGQLALVKNGTNFKTLSGRHNVGAGTTTYTVGEGATAFYSLPTDVWRVEAYYPAATTVFTGADQCFLTAEMV